MSVLVLVVQHISKGGWRGGGGGGGGGYGLFRELPVERRSLANLAKQVLAMVLPMATAVMDLSFLIQTLILNSILHSSL